MPEKLDRCVQEVKKEYTAKGKSEKESISTAYAICSKSTGFVKSGSHEWKKKIQENFTVSSKIDKLIMENDERFQDGLYVEAKLDPTGLRKVWDLLKKVGFNNLLPINNAHITIIYSRRAPNKEFKVTPINGNVKPSHFEIFGGKKGNPFVLALVVESSALEKKHKEYMREYQLRDGFREYKPHITMVYDIMRLLPGLKLKNPKAKKSIENMFNLLIKDMPKQINILKEEASPLNEDKF